MHLEDLAGDRIEQCHVVSINPGNACRAQLSVSPVEVLDLLASMQLRTHLDDAPGVG